MVSQVKQPYLTIWQYLKEVAPCGPGIRHCTAPVLDHHQKQSLVMDNDSLMSFGGVLLSKSVRGAFHGSRRGGAFLSCWGLR